MPGRDIHPLTVIDGTPVPLPDSKGNSDTILFNDRQKTQTLVNLSYIYQNPNGFFPLSTRLPYGVEIALPETKANKDNESLLAVRLHISQIGQLQGLESLDNLGQGYLENLFDALKNTQLHDLMDEDIKRYWRDNSLHGKEIIDLVLPYIYRTGRSGVHRAVVPKQWGMILFGRLSPELTIEDLDGNYGLIKDYIDSLEIPESAILNNVPKEFCGIFRPCEKPEVCKKTHAEELTDKEICEIERNTLLAIVNKTLANKIGCHLCDQFFSGKRALYGHLTAVHEFDDNSWLKDNPPEPFVSIRKLVPPAKVTHTLDQFSARLGIEPPPPSEPEGKIQKIETMVQLSNHRASETKNKANMKRKINIPKWLKPHLKESKLEIPAKGSYHSVRVELLWHSPPIERKEAHRRQVTTLPTKWEFQSNEVLQKIPVIANGLWDGKSNHILFAPQDNNYFIEWNEQGIKSDMIILASFEIY